MRLLLAISLCVLALLAALVAEAKPPHEGFLKGPYLDFIVGVTQADYDTDQSTGSKVGRNYEPSLGLTFGWNLYDWFSTEISGRYITDLNSGRREHIAAAGLYAKFTWISDWLTDFPTFRVLPFAKAGIGTHIALLPGAPGSTDSRVTDIGYGPSVGAGMAFIWKKYFHFGVDVQGDLLFFDDLNQMVGGTETLVYQGGFHPSLGVTGFLGVHY